MSGTLLGLGSALLAAVLFGVGAVLQAQAVRTEPEPIDSLAEFVRAAVRNRLIVLVVLTYLAGFGLHAVSIWYLPLYLAQAAVALSLPVTALSAAWVRERLTTADWTAVVAIVAGLVLVSLGSGAPGPGRSSPLFAAALWTGVLALAAAGLFGLVSRGGALGTVAGLGYAGSAVAVRGVDVPLDVPVVAAALAVPAYGLLAFWLYSLALNRAAVASASAPLVVGQTLVPALVGLWALGDSVRDGWAAGVTVGMVAAVTGAVLLSRRTADPATSSDAALAR